MQSVARCEKHSRLAHTWQEQTAGLRNFGRAGVSPGRRTISITDQQWQALGTPHVHDAKLALDVCRNGVLRVDTRGLHYHGTQPQCRPQSSSSVPHPHEQQRKERNWGIDCDTFSATRFKHDDKPNETVASFNALPHESWTLRSRRSPWMPVKDTFWEGVSAIGTMRRNLSSRCFGVGGTCWRKDDALSSSCQYVAQLDHSVEIQEGSHAGLPPSLYTFRAARGLLLDLEQNNALLQSLTHVAMTRDDCSRKSPRGNQYRSTWQFSHVKTESCRSDVVPGRNKGYSILHFALTCACTFLEKSVLLFCTTSHHLW